MSVAPRVSILIPNFNNGRQSSRGGAVDLIGDLLASLRDTLADDPTPVEIIAYDDGSTDDSLATLRRWAADGFLRLIEAEHCGVLAKTANRLVAEASGEFLVRLDGDIEVLTPNWAEKLCAIFDHGPADLGVVGPKQLTPDARWVHSFGDFILHPKGYHHLHQGAERHAVTRAAEVDHVMGCFYCCKRAVHDELGGYDENILRGQTIEFGLRSRLAGYRCFAVPQIEFTHRHALREMRANHADTDGGIDRSRQSFEDKWGFDRLAADLDVVRHRYARTPLLWNAEVFGVPADAAYALASGPTPTIETSQWKRYADDLAFRQQLDFRVTVARQLASRGTGAGAGPGAARVGVIGAGDGLLVHLLAQHGLTCEGAEVSASHLALGQQFLAGKTYPGSPPTLIRQGDPRRLPWDDGALDVVLWAGTSGGVSGGGIGGHPNPTGVLREARRVMSDNAIVAVLASTEDYLAHELAMRVRAVHDWAVPTPEAASHPDRPTVVLAARDRAIFDRVRSEAA